MLRVVHHRVPRLRNELQCREPGPYFYANCFHSEVIFSVPMSEVSLLAKLKITVVNGFSGVDTGHS